MILLKIVFLSEGRLKQSKHGGKKETQITNDELKRSRGSFRITNNDYNGPSTWFCRRRQSNTESNGIIHSMTTGKVHVRGGITTGVIPDAIIVFPLVIIFYRMILLHRRGYPAVGYHRDFFGLIQYRDIEIPKITSDKNRIIQRD
ncbi:MAG TPA: hypothetical protein VMT57_03890 [Candidatus Thermoplasmatota archaeon]|nr:hypothetical protein [Candidatus Thermoplasmatota archaeon]